ncbi:hypothetical protein [Streptomyces sp. DH24]|uniref:hypothetical protein n=1 Tax=Streptomyces sp. DH24 TaxID=3040123 RepID=UPI0024412816|nr:hypothetical protein [Streptomyces sp. DH24]MDG9719108.1 hypothetical protein [Streptomyces sp. DH24]
MSQSSGRHGSGKISRRGLLALGGALAGGAVVAGASPASASTDWIRLPVVTANIGRTNLGAREAAIRDVRYCDTGHRPLVGWQEIREGDGDSRERSYITRYFGDAYANPFLWHDTAYRVPLSVPAPWTVVSRGSTFVHGGISGVTPPRWINEAVVRHSRHPALEFALINTHYIANAHNGSRNPDLRDEWDLHKQKHKDRVLAHHRAGRAVIWTADTNNPDYARATGWKAERQVFFRGIDRINWMPGDGRVRLELLGTRTVDMRVDGHDARVALFRIRLV